MRSTTAFRALAHRNFRLYFFGQGVSVLGTWMQQVAVAWLVYRLTDSPLWLGLVAFAGQVPALFLAPPAGALIDRANRHRLVLLTQTLAMVLAFILATLTFSGVVAVWHLIVLNLLAGAVDALDVPARQFLLTEMVGRDDDLANAIALNSSIFNAARLLGPALAGILLAHTSAAVCFLANGISYLAVLAALLAMRLPRAEHPGKRVPFLNGLREGFTYVWKSDSIRALLLLAGLVSMAATACTTLLPVVATSILHGDASTLGALTAATGAGALAGSLILAIRRSMHGLGRWIAVAPAVFGLGLIAFSCSHVLWGSAVLMGASGFALLVLMASINTVLQALVDDNLRGRVMSLYATAVMGLAPIGSLLSGLLADHVGAAVTLRLGGLVCVVGSLVFAARRLRLREEIRPAIRFTLRSYEKVSAAILNPSQPEWRRPGGGQPVAPGDERPVATSRLAP